MDDGLRWSPSTGAVSSSKRDWSSAIYPQQSGYTELQDVGWLHFRAEVSQTTTRGEKENNRLTRRRGNEEIGNGRVCGNAHLAAAATQNYYGQMRAILISILYPIANTE